MTLRERKLLATRQSISTVATRLFHKKGFDAVTIDEIAAAAEVSRMTVFNHFPKKEDMFFDRLDEAKALFRGVTSIAQMRNLAHRLAEEASPMVRFTAGSQSFVDTLAASPTLKARAREIRDELWQVLGEAMSKTEGDATAQLVSGMIMITWTVALIHAHRTYRDERDAARAKAEFLAVFDRGIAGVTAAS